MDVIKKENYKVPVLSWCPDIEDSAMEQVDNLAELPFVEDYVALMPDAHAGYGMPIGGVIACNNVIIPNAVGVDIGCGVLAVKTDAYNLDQDTVKKIMGVIRKRIPVGMKWNKTQVYDLVAPPKDLPVVNAELNKAKLQLSSLGGGNHFVEIQQESEGVTWFMIHSGSRNLGKQVADHYNKIAVDLNKRWYTSVPEKWQLAFLPKGDPNFDLYLAEMEYAVDFAHQNRAAMASVIRGAFLEVLDTVQFEPELNIAHNYASLEHVNGKNLYVHRKGATAARKDQLGIIPGSQGTASYIVRGLGNPKSFNSCSHGAGRKMGRKEAQRTLSLEEEIAKLDKLGIVHSIRNQKDLDEAASAYKDIDEVMENQKDLVEIVTKLTPLGVVKG